jgi:BirA family biotin operon repressor/biotin-[acetyl-CoA-carboxylase] ligase
VDKPSAFDPAAFQAGLTTSRIGRYFVHRDVVDSTMAIARREAVEGAPHGTAVLAEEQTAGRGRRGRTFYSPARQNIYVTFVLRCPLDVHRRLPLIVPLAACLAIQADEPRARIKWPNDIWIGDRKISGMLIDAEISSSGALALPGIGINVNGDPTVLPELREIATSLARELGHPAPREPLLARLCNELERLCAAPAGGVLDAYRENSSTLGRQVFVLPAGGEPFEGAAYAIEEDGSLAVRLASGATEVVTAADVTIRPLG